MGPGFESQQDHASNLGADYQRVINENQRLFPSKKYSNAVKKKAKFAQKWSEIVRNR